jgi:hypothetical protein
MNPISCASTPSIPTPDRLWPGSFGDRATLSGGRSEAHRAITEYAQRIQKAANLILNDNAANAEEVTA